MSKIRQLSDASVLDAPKPRPRELSAAAIARQKEFNRLRDLMNKLTEPSQVYEIILEPSEKALTVQTTNETIVIQKDEIEARTASKVSMMPEGTFDKLSEAEVRDLVAYLRGRQQVPLPK